MASSLSILSLPSSSTRTWKHHVFPSFHGPDVRKAFLSHILNEFRTKGIDPFIDNNIERGKAIGPELIEAIRGSRIAIVLLSKNYPSSTWCLDELVEIINCKDVLGQTVMVLFYEVDPTDVKNQTGDFGKVFRETCESKKEEVIGRWKHALVEVATIAGYHSRNWDNEAEMIKTIASDVSNKLNNSTISTDFEYVVGTESHLIMMGSLLRLKSEEVRIVGIWGPPGIGKTTIARFLFNQQSENFQLSVFMENIRASYPISACSDNYSMKKYFQEQFMSQLINEKAFKVPHLGIIKDRLKDKKVLVVLDDVDRLVQLEAIANQTSWFGPWSRIIITTQDRKILQAGGVKHIYTMDFPSRGEALQMFCMYAFGQKFPKDGFTKLAWEVIKLAGGLPLGLRVMGSYFRGMAKHEWINALPRLKTRLDGEIESILKFSYDALCDEDKNLFLHIACFFNHEQVSDLEVYLGNSFTDVRQGLRVLVEKSLIYLHPLGIIHMHKFLVQLGTEIVRKQSVNNPGRRLFLNDARDIGEVFSDDKSNSSNVIGIHLMLTNDNKREIICTSMKAFERWSNLQFLRIDGDITKLFFPESLNSILGKFILRSWMHFWIPRLPYNLYFSGSQNSICPKLRLLSWKHFPMPCLPSNFNPKSLVKLDMRRSNLKKLWEGIQPLTNLKWMDLSESERLEKVPDLSTATNLHELKLRDCLSLVELPFSIGNAINLQKLDLSNCSNLVRLPSSIGNAISLQKLDLYCCKSLVELPSSMINLRKLSELILEGCLKLEICLTNINLESLENLNLRDCSLLKCHHETSTNIEDLKPSETAIEEVSYSKVQELGPWMGRKSRLHNLALSRRQISLPQLPDSLEYIDAINCEFLERLDCSFRDPDIRLLFAGCFKLNKEARDLIIHTPTSRYAVLPGRGVPVCFTYQSSGSSLRVKLIQKPLHTSTKFKACIIFAKNETKVFRSGIQLYCSSITSKQNPLTACIMRCKTLDTFHPEHLYIFEVEAENVTSTELVFEFEAFSLHTPETWWEIKECGVFELLEDPSW